MIDERRYGEDAGRREPRGKSRTNTASSRSATSCPTDSESQLIEQPIA